MGQTETEWMEIDLSTIKTKRKTTIRGHQVDLFVSPYDIPKALKAILDDTENILTIKLKYLNDEPTVFKKHNDNVTYEFGKISHRLYGVQINISSLFAQNQTQAFTKLDRFKSILNKLTESSEEITAKDNYEVAKDAIKAKEKELFVMAA